MLTNATITRIDGAPAVLVDNDSRERREDWRFGMLAAVTANCHSLNGRFSASDFVPSEAREAVSEDEAKSRLRAWATACGGQKSAASSSTKTAMKATETKKVTRAATA